MNPSFLVIDKPAGVTSHDVVGTFRAVTGIRKVGHTGTLDPFATGVLVLAIGQATRLIEFLDERSKVYEATLKLGQETDTGDLEGEVVGTSEVPALDVQGVQAAMDALTGPQLQRPHAYSAVKVQGKPLYWYARQGIAVQVEPRPIEVFDWRADRVEGDEVSMTVDCSRGTYVRVLGEDLARSLGTLGHLTTLRRLSSGGFDLSKAVTMQHLSELVAAEPGHDWHKVLMTRGRHVERVPWNSRDGVREALAPHFIGLSEALGHLATVQVPESDIKRIRSGARPPLPSGAEVGDRFGVLCGEEWLAVAEVREPGAARIVKGIAPA